MHKQLLNTLLTGLLVAGSLVITYAQTRSRITPVSPAPTVPVPTTPKTDLLVRRDGTQLEVLITEITDKEIVYKRASNPNGPVFRGQKVDFSFVKYGSNDEIERFVAETAPVQAYPVPQPQVDQPRIAASPAVVPQGMRFGFKAGIQSASWSLSGSGLVGYSAKGIVGFQAGLLLDLPLGKSLRLRPQLLYSGKGTNLGAGSNNADITVGSIELPVDILFKIPTSSGQLLLGGGGYFGGAISGKAGTEELKIGNAATDDIKSTDFGLRFSGWYDLPSGLTLNVFYNLGLADINPATNQQATIKNRTFGVGLGYFLSKK